MAALLGIPPLGRVALPRDRHPDLPTGNIGHWQHSHIGNIPPPPASHHPKTNRAPSPLPENFFMKSYFFYGSCCDGGTNVLYCIA